MAIPLFQGVVHVDPWGTVTPGTSDLGVQVTVSNDGDAPTDYVLIGRLLEGVTPLAYGTGGTAAYLFVTPPGPLSAAVAHSVEVQWSPSGTDPSEADWTAAGVVSAPVITAGVTITGGTVTTSQLAFSWAAAGPAQPSAGYVQVLDLNATPKPQFVAWIFATGGSGSTQFSVIPSRSYAAYASTAALIDPGTPGVYTIGPSSPPVAVPAAAPAPTTVAFDGSTLAVAWTPPAPPSSPVVAETSYALALLSSGNVAGSFPAGAGGATVVAGPAALGGGTTVAGAISYGPIAGPVGTGQPILVAAPSITAVTMATSNQQTELTVTVAPIPAVPSATSVRVSLLRDGVVATTQNASGTPLTAELTTTLVSGSRYAVVADMAIPAAAPVPAVTGPASDTMPVVPGPISGLSVSYDGALVHLTWTGSTDPALTGYRVDVTGLPQTTFVTGPQPALSVPATLAVGAELGVVVTPLAGAAAGLPSVTNEFTVPAPAAPQIVTATLDGAQATLAWSPSAGPWLDGYQLVLSGTVAQGPGPTLTVYTGLEPSTTVTLPAQDQPVAWSAAVAATARGSSGPASTSVALFAAVPEVTGVTVSGSTATVDWALVPGTTAVLSALAAASARVQVQVLDDDNVVAAASTAIASAATGSTGVALPTPVTGRLRVAAQIVASRQAGSRSDGVALLTRTPTVAFGALLGGELALRWSGSGDAGVTGYRVCADATCVTVAGTDVVLPLPAGAPAPATVTVTPTGADTTGPAASVAVVSAYGVVSGGYSAGSLSVTLSAAGTPTPAQVRVDVLVDGALAARTVAAGTQSAVTVPVALAPGASAVVRAAGVGSGSLAPPSPPVAVPTSPPAAPSATYDGTALHVAWEPVPDPGVTGYLVSVSGASPAVEPVYVSGAASAGTTIAATFSGAFPGGASVTVQASVATATDRIDGPAGAAAVPALAGSVRSVVASASNAPPYTMRRGTYVTAGAAQAAPVTAYLANVFPSGTPTVTDGGTPATFTLAPVSQQVAVPGGPPYVLTIAQSVWTSFDGNAARAALRTAYRSFLQNVDGQSAPPDGMALVRQAIAAAMPQTFAETLYYRYGLWQDGSLRVVDLDPGLRLRLAGASYQTPSGSSGDPRNGFVALGTEEYDLAEIFPVGTVQGLAPALTVDAFLSALLPGGGAAAGTTIAAGSADFFGPGARQAYFRLFYPRVFPPSGGEGSASTASNVTVVGAQSWTALENATNTYATSGNLPAGGSLFIAYFRGRAMLTPLAAVRFGGERWVPVGTTVRQLLAGAGAPGAGVPVGAQVRMMRRAAGFFETAQGGAAMRTEPVDLSGAGLGSFVPQLWPLDLPLLGGDEIDLTDPAP